MKSIVTAAALSFCAAAVLAGPTCNVPKDQWMKEADLKARLVSEGYEIKTFKVSKGQCYEIYGYDKNKQKVEIYFDPATGTPIETKKS